MWTFEPAFKRRRLWGKETVGEVAPHVGVIGIAAWAGAEAVGWKPDFLVSEELKLFWNPLRAPPCHGVVFPLGAF